MIIILYYFYLSLDDDAAGMVHDQPVTLEQLALEELAQIVDVQLPRLPLEVIYIHLQLRIIFMIRYISLSHTSYQALKLI